MVTTPPVQFDVNYTSAAPIVFTITVDGSGYYFMGLPFGDVTNSTSASFPSLFAYFVGAPAGVTFDGAGWDPAVFSNGATFIPSYPNTTELAFTGSPGLGSGVSFAIGVDFSATSSAPETFEVV